MGNVNARMVAVTKYIDLANSSDEKKQLQGLDQLLKLASKDEYTVPLFNIPAVVQVMLRGVLEGEKAEIREAGLIGIQNLACADENKVPMLNTPRLV